MIGVCVALGNNKFGQDLAGLGHKAFETFLGSRDIYNNSRAGELQSLVNLKNNELQERLNKQPDGVGDLCKQVMNELSQLMKSASSAN